MKPSQSHTSIGEPGRRALRLVLKIFAPGWIVALALMFALGASLPEYIASTIVVGGIGLAWVVAIHVLHRKNPLYVQDLLKNEHTDDENPNQPRL